MINIVEKKKIFFIISIVLIVIGIASMIIQGFAMDIEFQGGINVTAALGQEFKNSDIEALVKDAIGVTPSSVQKSGENGEDVVIKIMYQGKNKELASADREKLTDALIEKYGIEADAISISNVSATVGKEMLQKSFLLCLITVILMLVYITIRFELMSGISAVVALVHDVLIMLSFYSLFQIPVNSSFIAAILTILGYSINASIMVFDRIRERRRFATKKTVLNDLVNESIMSTMGRSINTTITTFLTVALLCVFGYMMGITSLVEFTLPIIVGILAGFYSSVFVAGPFWAMCKGGSNK